MRIHFIHHSSFIIHTNDITIYIDPYKISSRDIQKTDLILITHDHYDHLSLDDIKKISTLKTNIVFPDYISIDKFNDILGNKIKITTHETLNISGINISTIPAYNSENSYHLKNQGVGYIFEIKDNQKTYHIYHAGDTDYTKEMSTLRGIDFALIPIGGTYTMDDEQASEFVLKTLPKNVIPMHYKNTVGINLNSNIEKTKKICKEKNINFIELSPNETKDFF